MGTGLNPADATLPGRLTRAAVRHPLLTCLVWVLSAVLLVLVSPSLNEVGQQDESAFLPTGSTSLVASETLRREFPDDPTLNGAVVVLSRPEGLTARDHAFAREVAHRLDTQLPQDVARVTGVGLDPRLAPVLRAEDGKAELVLATLKATPFTEQASAAVARLSRLVRDGAPQGLGVDVTGTAAVGHDQVTTITDSFGTVGVVSVLLVLTILVIVYRSVVAALVPLVSIGVAFAVASSLVAQASQAGLQVASMAATFIVVLIFGAGTDYCLFLISRYRGELATTGNVSASVQRTSSLVAPVIVASGATVALGFLSQLTARFGFYRSMGPAVAIAITVTVLASITLTPALLALLGRHVFWPGKDFQNAGIPAGRVRRWQRLAGVVARFPLEMCIGSVAALTLLSGGIGWLQTSSDIAGELPASAPSRVGADVLSRHYPAGTLAPVSVLVAGSSVRTAANSTSVDRLTDELRQIPGVADVKGPTQPAGQPLFLDPSRSVDAQAGALGIDPNRVDVTPLYNALASDTGLRLTTDVLRRYPVLAEATTPYVGVEGNAFRLVVTLGSDPFADDAQRVVDRVMHLTRERLAGSAAQGATVTAAGPGPTFADIGQVAQSDFYRIAAMLFVVIVLVLTTLLRSWLLPLLLTATAVLSYGAALGVAVVAGRLLLGQDTMTFYLPTFLLVILVALGADYNIFIASRIQEARQQGLSAKQAALTGLVETGPVISSAGLILAGTFASLLVAPIPTLRVVAVAVAVGVLVDTYLVRPLLVPALVIVLGDRAFWPQRSDAPTERLLPRWHRPTLLAGWATAVVATTVLISSAHQPVQLATVSATAPSQAVAEPRAAASSAVRASPTGRPLPSTTNSPHAGPTIGPPARQTAAPGVVRTRPAQPQLSSPEPGSWTYHVTGTRRIGLAGSTQPFEQHVDHVVAVLSRDGRSTTISLRTDTHSESTEDRRRYSRSRIELLATQQQSAGQSYQGTFDPPQLLLPWPARVGATWSSSWTSEDSYGRTDSRITAVRRLNVAGESRTCVEVVSHTVLRGSVSGTVDRTTCWVAELGMIGREKSTIQVTSRGVPYDSTSTSTLLRMP